MIERGSIRMGGINENAVRGWVLRNGPLYIAGSFRVTWEGIVQLRDKTNLETGLAAKIHYATVTIGAETTVAEPDPPPT